MWKALLVLCMASNSIGFELKLGPCPNVKSISNLDLEKISGKWYIQRQSPFILDSVYQCPTTTITHINDKLTKLVDSLYIPAIRTTAYKVEIVRINPNDPATWTIESPDYPVEISYKILDTDYSDYVSVLTCANLLLAHMEFGLIATRERNATDSIPENAENAFTETNVKVKSFITPNQDDCPPN